MEMILFATWTEIETLLEKILMIVFNIIIIFNIQQ